MAKEDILFYKCSFKSNPRSAYYVTVLPYSSNKVLFRPPHSANSQKTLAKQRGEPLEKHATAGRYKHKNWLSDRDQLRFPWSRNTP